MNFILLIILEGFFFLLILFLGYRLHKLGKPYPVILYNAHKLISLGEVVLLVITVHNLIKTETTISPILIALICVTSILMITMIITGGLLSMEKLFPQAIQIIHKIFPYLSLASYIVLIYLILSWYKDLY